jgi:hypothetical protein
MLVKHADLKHDGIKRNHAGMVGHHESGACRRHVLKPAHLDAEPAPVQRPCCRHQHGVVEVRVEARFGIYLILAGGTPPDEFGGTSQAPHPWAGHRRLWGAHIRIIRIWALPGHRCSQSGERAVLALGDDPQKTPAAPAGEPLLLVSALNARLAQQLAVLLLRHPLAPLLDY